MTPSANTEEFVDTSLQKKIEKSLAARWHHRELFDAGFVAVPTLFLELYSQLNPPLTSGEAMFVIQLMAFKWSRKPPFPGYDQIARRMGTTDKTVRRHAANLETKRYLRRIRRYSTTNKFDLSPLFNALFMLAKVQYPFLEQKYKDTYTDAEF